MCASEVTPEAYPLHFAVAKEFGGEVKPFDQYQGPYVVIGGDIRSGSGPYAVAVQGLGVVRLWLCSEDGVWCYWYREDTDKKSDIFLSDHEESESWAIECAREILNPVID